MKKYAKIIDDTNKICEVGVGSDTSFYKSIGMTELDVELAFNGNWYLSGFVPAPSPEDSALQEINELKQKLAETDYCVIKIAEEVAEPSEYSDVLAQRKTWRARINELEAIIGALNAE